MRFLNGSTEKGFWRGQGRARKKDNRILKWKRYTWKTGIMGRGKKRKMFAGKILYHLLSSISAERRRSRRNGVMPVGSVMSGALPDLRCWCVWAHAKSGRGGQGTGECIAGSTSPGGDMEVGSQLPFSNVALMRTKACFLLRLPAMLLHSKLEKMTHS